MSADINALADALLAARDSKAAADAEAKNAGARVKHAEAALFSAMVEAELDKVSAHGYSFGIDAKTYYRATDADALHDVLETLGRGDIFRFSVNYQTLNATLRELAEQSGGELPAEVAAHVDTYDEGKIAVRKAPQR